MIGQFPKLAPAYQLRAIAHAHLGEAKEAKADLATLQELGTEASQKAYLEAVVSAYLGEDAEGLKRLEAAITANAKPASFLYDAACAYALASQAVAGKDAARSKSYGDRAAAWLQEAVASGYSDYRHMQSDPDLDPIQGRADFVALLWAGRPERLYSAVWHSAAGRSSSEVHGLDPAGHLARCRALFDRGYRPASLSVREVGADQPLVTASVWHRPVVPEDDKEHLAKRQANAAVALLRMGRADKVWPVLRHSPDPRVRSYLIHRLSPLGADPKAIVKWLDEEEDVSVRRALLLALGEFGEKELAPSERDVLLPKLFGLYRDDADAGLHGAAEWLLRQWSQQAKVKAMENEWRGDGEEVRARRGARLGRIRQGIMKDKERGQWYVNGQGQTMVVIPGPVTFLMGSPLTEAGREGGPEGKVERQHKKRIGRSFAIAAREVTVKQFGEFLKSRKESIDAYYNHRFSPTADCPVNQVTWYDAAAYCNWLSEQEGIPNDQWCYEPNKDGEYAEGMKLAPDYLHREGYRLPSEAEWEYACRARAVTSRSYGETEELLGKFAWYTKHSQDRGMLPGEFGKLGVPGDCLKPNDFGLFDMLGNTLEWCQESVFPYSRGPGGKAAEDIEDKKDITDKFSRVLRGGSVLNQAVDVRSAFRGWNVPSARVDIVGFRPARTFH